MPDPDRAGMLFMCVANSARSQMAEGIARIISPMHVRIFSAGSEPTQVNQFAVRAMKEVGINITTHHSKTIEEIPLDQIGTVITLCAEEVCPTLPGKVKQLHWPLPDPAATTGSDEDIIEAFRRVREDLRERISGLF